MTACGEIAVSVGDGKIVVRELTFAEVRSWLAEEDVKQFRDPIAVMAFEDIGLDDIAHMVDVSATDLEKYRPSELEPVIAAARRLNPHFFRLRAALMQAVRTLSDAAAGWPSSTETPQD